MNSNQRIAYTKPWISVADQLSLLRGRGLTIVDEAKAFDFLHHVNYYCFSGYCLAFRDRDGRFRVGTTFEDVVFSYRFDAELRDVLNEALELVEIDLCTRVSHHFGRKYSPFGHVDPLNFHPGFSFTTTHEEWLSKLREEVSRSKEQYVQHFKDHHLEFPDLPIWATTELMSFGSLSHMISGMHKRDRQEIALEYGLRAVELSSASHHFTYVRNLCSHHARLWDRTWVVHPQLPSAIELKGANTIHSRRVFSTLLLVSLMLKRARSLDHDRNRWRLRVTSLLQSLPNVPNALYLLGLPADWQNHHSWTS